MATSSMEGYSQLLSLAVHEFRTPASVVGGYLRMLQRDGASLSERHRKMIDEAEKACARIVALIAELSDIGKLDAGTISLARQRFDAFVLVAEVADGVHEAEERDVHLSVRGDASGARMDGDSGRLRAAFEAIFRATLREKSGPCTVVAERRRESIDGHRCAVLVVAEESRVHAAYEAPRGVFDEKRGGMGLALPLARRVIEGHGGLLWSPANADASGDAVVVALPLTE